MGRPSFGWCDQRSLDPTPAQTPVDRYSMASCRFEPCEFRLEPCEARQS